MNKHLNIALEVFSVLGKTPEDFINDKFKFYCVHNWETPSFSPIVLLPGEYITEPDIKYIEDYFKKHPITNRDIKNTPFFNYFGDKGLYDDQAIKQICDKMGWSIDPNPLSVNLLQSPIQINLPRGFSISIYNSFENGITEAYKDVLRHNFNANVEYIKNVECAYNDETINSYTILIKSHNEECVGGGSVSLRNGFGFLTWGAVNEQYRNRGFHQVLLAACKSIATAYGVNVCGYTTRNRFIVDKCDSSIEMYICRKEL